MIISAIENTALAELSFSTTDRALSSCFHVWHIRSYLSSRSVLTLASQKSNGTNQKSMWIFSKKIIQKEYPGSDGKHSKDPTGRRSLCLRALGCSNVFDLGIVHLLIGKGWLLGQLLLISVFMKGSVSLNGSLRRAQLHDFKLKRDYLRPVIRVIQFEFSMSNWKIYMLVIFQLGKLPESNN